MKIVNEQLARTNVSSTVQRGFTLTELIITVTILLTLLSLVSINLSYAHRRASLNTSITTLIADLKEQQIKAMVGDTEGRSSADSYGIHFDADKYVLFNGTTYTATTSGRGEVVIESSQQFTTTNRDIIFTRVSGDIFNYSSASATITLKDNPSGNTKTIQMNKYGVITSVN